MFFLYFLFLQLKGAGYGTDHSQATAAALLIEVRNLSFLIHSSLDEDQGGIKEM